jgi:hypothetical protein
MMALVDVFVLVVLGNHVWTTVLTVAVNSHSLVGHADIIDALIGKVIWSVESWAWVTVVINNVLSVVAVWASHTSTGSIHLKDFIGQAVVSSAIESIMSWSGVCWTDSASSTSGEDLIHLAVRHDAIVSSLINGGVHWALVALTIESHELIGTSVT